MKFEIALTAVLILTLNQAVFAETQANSGSFDDIEYGPPEEIPPAPVKFKPASKARAAVPAANSSVSAPASAPSAMVKMVPQANGCPVPQLTAEAAKTPLKVTVDQEAQTISIVVDGKKLDLHGFDRVSTGGTLKIPDGSNGAPPYCAQTPAMHEVVAMVKESDFANTKCDSDYIRDKSTVFPVYYSRTFGDASTGPIPMPKAIRIKKGIFFHEVPPSYKDALGNDISGECVRLHPRTAALLYKQMEKYGAIDITIKPPRQHQMGETLKLHGKSVKMYCDQRDVDAAIAAKRSGNTSTALAQNTGSEGVVGAPRGFDEAAADVIDPFGIWGINKRGNVFTRGQNQPPRPKAGIPHS